MSWTGLLFASKWVIIGLVYFVLFIILLAVRQEMSVRIRAGAPPVAASPGQLRILNPGSDRKSHPGDILYLPPNASLGAAQDNDLVLNDAFVSAHHARLRWDGAAWFVEDLGSRNGTFLDGRRLPPFQSLPVPIGSTLQIGDMAFTLQE